MRKRTMRIIAAVLAFVLFFEPIALQAVKAAETTSNGNLPEPTVINEEVGLMNPEDILPPHEYLDIMLDARGHTQEEVELRAWGEWQELINSAYLVIDEGAADVFGLYDALSVIKKVKSDTCEVGSTIKDIANYAHMATAFFERTATTRHATTALGCWSRMNQWTERFVNWTKQNQVLNFLSFCSPPDCWHNVENTAKGMDQYWHWLQKKGGKDVETELTNAQGVARSIGIGFAIVGTVLSIWNYERNEDKQVGRWSYNRVKDLVAVHLALAGIVAMFCIPIVGQVLAIVAAIWGVVTYIGDLIGEFRAKWKNAYKSSFWYLYNEDPEFKVYYDNRDILPREEKSASWLVVEEKYGEFKTTAEAIALDANATEADKKTSERNLKIYEELEKNGVLSSYYSRSENSLPSMTTSELMELWEMKASYMAWKPTEAESKKKKGFWDYVGAVVDPKTYIGWAANGIGSIDYKKKIKNEDIKRVYFNPDFVLQKRYISYITARRLMGTDPFYNVLGLRIEQSPFNYIPLVGIETSSWTRELLDEALLGDSFIVGQKEMAAIHNQIELAVEGLDDSIDETDKLIKKLQVKEIPHAKQVREFLDELAEAYSEAPEKENKRLYNKAKRLMSFTWDNSKKKTPANIIEATRENIEKALMYEPLALGQKAADMVLLNITVKQHIDMATLMNTYVEEKQQALDNFNNDFKNKDIASYIKEGSFLNVKGDSFLDWLAELYSAYDDADKTLKQMKKDVAKYDKLAKKGASNDRGWFTSIATPLELVETINEELSCWKNTVDAWDNIASDVNVKVVLAENRDFAEKIWAEYDTSKIKLQALDPENDSLLDIDLPPYSVSADSTTIEGAAEVLLED